MAVPEQVRKVTQEAVKAMHDHPEHDLTLGYRQAVWDALGPPLGKAKPGGSIGHKRRARLAILTVRHVLPIWKKARPKDDTPQRLLAMAEKVLDGKLDRKSAQEEMGTSWSYMDSLAAEDDSINPMAVGYAAVGALGAAARDELFDPESIDLEMTDDDIDPYMTDASFAAAAAYANGRVDDPDSDAKKRKRFWEWWLKTAIPKACEEKA